MRVIDLTQALADSLNEREPADEILVNGIRYVRYVRADTEGGVPEGYEEVPLYRAYERLRTIQEYAATTTGNTTARDPGVWRVPPILMPKIPSRLVPAPDSGKGEAP